MKCLKVSKIIKAKVQVQILIMCILYPVFQEIYEEEGLQMEEFESPYTQQCIELLCGLDNSIFTIMNEVCNHPKQVKSCFKAWFQLGVPYTQQCIELLCGLDNSIFTIMNEVCNHPKQVKLGFHRRYIKVQDNQRMSTMSIY